MLAPEPFFEPRGTPFSEYHRIKVLGELGYHIDLVTYPFGVDVQLPNLRIFRSWRPPLIRRVPIGPSVVKVLLDMLLAGVAIRLILREKYTAIHSHEEAGLLGIWLARWLGIPHLYDMHSSLPEQLSNFRYTRMGILHRLFLYSERQMILGSRVVIAICRELLDLLTAMGEGDRVILIENVMGGDFDEGVYKSKVEVRTELGISASQPLVLYSGTLEAYQGLDLLISAASFLRKSHPDARVLVVGGDPSQVAAAKKQADQQEVNIVFTGQRPPYEIPRFIGASDILVSPRVSGMNTPLKIYSYLRSGKPIVATDLVTHSQVLDESTAMLVPAEPKAFALGIGQLIDHPEERERIASSALEMAARKYSRENYVAKTRKAYERLLSDENSLEAETTESVEISPGGWKTS